MHRQATTGISPFKGRPIKARPAKDDGSHEINGIEIHLWSRQPPGRLWRSSGTAIAWNQIDPPAISNQFHAIRLWRMGKHTENLPEAGPRFAHVVPIPGRLRVLKTADPKDVLLTRDKVSTFREEGARSTAYLCMASA